MKRASCGRTLRVHNAGSSLFASTRYNYAELSSRTFVSSTPITRQTSESHATNQPYTWRAEQEGFPVKPRDFEKPSDKRIEAYAQLVNKDLPENAGLKEILQAVWKNEAITSVCPDLIIRLTSLRGEVSKAIWRSRGKNPDDIQILAVGTTAIPQHIPKYHNFLRSFFANSAKYCLAEHHTLPFEIGYDLLSKGSDRARRAVMHLFNEHYDFPADVLDQCWHNAAITGGGMRGLKDLADACVLNAKAEGIPHRFIQPDNSFGTWWNILERTSKIHPPTELRREVHTLEAKQQNRLQLTPEDIKDFYKKHPPVRSELWYITPVGNPSGTKMSSSQLVATVETILENNPHANILLDSVYVRTLDRPTARALMSGLVYDNRLLKNVIFLESFSKSHGLCGERLGMYFSANEELFTKMHTANIAFSAGPGRHKDNQFLALGHMTEQDKEGVDELHQYWQQERKGLRAFLLSDKHKHLFEDNQSHLVDEDIDNPLGLYLLLKVRPGVKAQDVFMETGALGVDTALLSGHYIRFAVGGVIKPTYSKYLE